MHKVMQSYAWWPVVAVLAVAVTTDLMWRRIPNWLTGPFLAAGFAVSGWMHGWRGLAASAEGMGLGLLLYGILFCLGGMGAGDVKLCAAIGAWIGPGQLVIAMIFTALLGGLMAVTWAVSCGFSKELLEDTGNLILGRWKRKAEERPGAESGPEAIAEAGQGFEVETERCSGRQQRKMPYAPAIAAGVLLSFFAR
jgi:prepilin peptidase CpaA